MGIVLRICQLLLVVLYLVLKVLGGRELLNCTLLSTSRLLAYLVT